MPASTDLRPLTLDQAPAVEALLASGFPDRPASFWRGVLHRVDQHAENRLAEVPLGLGLYHAGELAGVALSPASLRRSTNGQVVKLVNLSSWTIRADQRWRAALMLRRLLADAHASYTDLTPTPAVMRMLPHFGMHPVNTGTGIWLLAAHALRPASMASIRPLKVGEGGPLEGPSVSLLDGHRSLACVPLLLEHAGGTDLLVYRCRRLRGVACAQLMYVHSHAVLQRCLPALARHLTSRGILLLECDVRQAEARSGCTWFRPRNIWYAKGGAFADRTDFLGTERCILGV